MGPRQVVPTHQLGQRVRAATRGAGCRPSWASFERNRTTSAWLLEHDDGPRPWLIGVHGFGTGAPVADMITFRAQHLFHELGWNVAAIVLPVHGSRRPSRIGGEDFLGFDMMNCVHALSQSVWDVRRLLSWVRTPRPAAVALHGVSLGGYVASLTSCFEGELDAVVAGIPVCDFPALFAQQAPRHVRDRAIEHRILDGNAEVVHRVVSPLAMPCLVPHERRSIFAGLGDRWRCPPRPRRCGSTGTSRGSAGSLGTRRLPVVVQGGGVRRRRAVRRSRCWRRSGPRRRRGDAGADRRRGEMGYSI